MDRTTRPTTALVLTSFTALFCELMLIRWLSSEVPVLAYFKNFPLLAMFVGFGVGCLLADARRSVLVPSLGVLGGLAAMVSVADLLGWNYLVFPERYLDAWGRGGPHGEQGRLWLSLKNLLPIFLLLACCMGAFLGFGQQIGRLMRLGPRLRMYSADIVGSLAGVLLFGLLSYLWTPPAVWITVTVVLLALTLAALGERLVRFVGVFALLGATVLVLVGRATAELSIVTWSPYYRIEVKPILSSDNKLLLRHQLDVNRDIHQNMVDLRTPGVLAYVGASTERVQWKLWRQQYDFPYWFKPAPASVLIGGAGAGNDVAAALRNGAGHITAVEIDPGILSLGKRLHPEEPYASPRVTAVNNDIRAFFRQSEERFDLIVLSILDSHTALSSLSSLRLDNYVYTVESIRDAVARLKPDGIMCLSFYAADRHWLGQRMRRIIELGSGRPPVSTNFGQTVYFVFGPGLDPDAGRGTLQRVGAPIVDSMYASESIRPSYDDWPFLYSNPAGQPFVYYLCLAALLVFAGWLVRWGLRQGTGEARAGLDWPMLFLGAGFLLIETKGLTELSLLFGSTWIVNTMVFAGIFLMVLLANFVVARIRFDARRTDLVFVMLAAALVFWFLFPKQVLNALPFLPRAVCGTLLVVLPLFFAGIIFATSFSQRARPAEAFGSNLVGAVLGGAVEASSLLFGIRALTLLALAFYGLSWLSGRKRGSP